MWRISDAKRRFLAVLIAVSVCAAPALADEDYKPMARNLVAETLYHDLHREVVVETILRRNLRQLDNSEEAILEFERQWRTEKLEGGGPLLFSVDQSSVSTYLRTLKAESGGLYTELLVMDRQGFLIGQSDIATDYFQGDERKYLMTFPVGAEAVFVDLVEYDESVQAIQSQVSFTIVDPDSGEAIGVATVGLNGNLL